MATESKSGSALSWPAVVAEATTHLQRMIQIDTINPPGNELALAKYLATVLEGEGIDATIVEATAARGALVARLRGGRTTGARAPSLLYTAHMDVVGVERAEWSVDPLAGTMRDGYVYGRGAIDDKGMLAAELMTLLLLQRHVIARGGSLDGDFIFAATADEETGGKYGMAWLIDEHPELIRADYAINEGGRIRIVNGRPTYAAIQTAEKVSNVVAVRATGPAGHASIPLEGNAIARLARAIHCIAGHREAMVLSPTTRAFFAGLAGVWPDAAQGAAMRELVSDDASLRERGERAISRVPLFDAVLRSGISPTVFNAGIRHNVIPANGAATLSVRTLPGERIEELVRRLRELVSDPQIEIEITDAGIDAPPSDVQSPVFRTMRDAIAELDPSLITVPYLSTGATESAKLRAWGVQTYGILPFPLSEDDERRMHGADERLPLSAFEFGIRLLHTVAYRTLVQNAT
jgi:acetylornithine deacetylase/succinyl-diaminopimelate desuccinylase-like protein